MQDQTRISPTADPLADIDPSQRPSFDGKRIENAVREIIIGIGEDPDRDGLQDTPKRVAKAYKQLFSGLYERPEDVLATTFQFVNIIYYHLSVKQVWVTFQITMAK